MATFRSEFPTREKSILYKDSDTNNTLLSNIKYVTGKELIVAKRNQYFTPADDNCFILKGGDQEELWKVVNIDGVDTHYMISNFGQVFSVATGIILKQVTSDRYNYMAYKYHDDDGNHKEKRFSTHALVARYFVKNPYPEYFIYVDHKDGNKKNNRADNLQWVTPQQNSKNAKYLGLLRKGESHPNCKYSESTIRKICELLEKGVREKDIMKKLNVKRTIVGAVKKRESWTWVSKDYDVDNGKFRLHIKPIHKAGIAMLLRSGHTIDNLYPIFKLGRTTVGEISKQRNSPEYDIYPEIEVLRALVLFMYDKDNSIKTISKFTNMSKEEVRNIIYEETNHTKS